MTEGSPCLQCGETLQYFDVNLTEELLMCSNQECLHPFEDCDLIFRDSKAAEIDLSSINNSKACENYIEDTDIVPQDFFTKIKTPKNRKSSLEAKSPPKIPISADDEMMIEDMSNIKLVKLEDKPVQPRPTVTDPIFLQNLKILAEKKERKAHPYTNLSHTATNFDIKVIKSDQNLDCIVINLTES